MFHWTDHSISVHVFTCVLALQIARLMRLRARRAGLELPVRELPCLNKAHIVNGEAHREPRLS